MKWKRLSLQLLQLIGVSTYALRWGSFHNATDRHTYVPSVWHSVDAKGFDSTTCCAMWCMVQVTVDAIVTICSPLHVLELAKIPNIDLHIPKPISFLWVVSITAWIIISHPFSFGASKFRNYVCGSYDVDSNTFYKAYTNDSLPSTQPHFTCSSYATIFHQFATIFCTFASNSSLLNK